MATITTIPPIVGVLFLSKCIRLSSSESVFEVSSPIFKARSFLINHWPKKMLIKNAVKAAKQERKDINLKISSELIEENQLYSKVYLTSLIVISCRFYLNQYLNSIINWYSLHEKSTKLLNNIFHVHTSGAFY